MKRIFYFLFAFVGVLLIVAFGCFKPLDTTPYQQTEFYKKELAAIDSAVTNHPPLITNQPLQVGWSRVNLLPPFATPIAIDAHRGGKHFEGVHDSIYVRAFVFKQGETKIAYISADLLIIPPSVTNMFDTILKKEGFAESNIFHGYAYAHKHWWLGMIAM